MAAFGLSTATLVEGQMSRMDPRWANVENVFSRMLSKGAEINGSEGIIDQPKAEKILSAVLSTYPTGAITSTDTLDLNNLVPLGLISNPSTLTVPPTPLNTPENIPLADVVSRVVGEEAGNRIARFRGGPIGADANAAFFGYTDFGADLASAHHNYTSGAPDLNTMAERSLAFAEAVGKYKRDSSTWIPVWNAADPGLKAMIPGHTDAMMDGLRTAITASVAAAQTVTPAQPLGDPGLQSVAKMALADANTLLTRTLETLGNDTKAKAVVSQMVHQEVQANKPSFAAEWETLPPADQAKFSSLRAMIDSTVIDRALNISSDTRGQGPAGAGGSDPGTPDAEGAKAARGEVSIEAARVIKGDGKVNGV